MVLLIAGDSPFTLCSMGKLSIVAHTKKLEYIKLIYVISSSGNVTESNVI